MLFQLGTLCIISMLLQRETVCSKSAFFFVGVASMSVCKQFCVEVCPKKDAAEADASNPPSHMAMQNNATYCA